MVRDLRRTKTPDRVLQFFQQSAFDSIDELNKIKYLSGRLHEDQSFVDNTAFTLYHNLGYTPRGFFLVDTDGSVNSVSGSTSLGSLFPPRTSREGYSTTVGMTHTMSFTPTDDRTLILFVTFDFATTSIDSISQTGVTWTKIDSQAGGATHSCEMWRGTAISSAGTGLTFTLTNANVNEASLCLAEYREIDAAAELDSDKGTGASTDFLELTGVTSTAVGQLMVAGVMNEATFRTINTMNGFEMATSATGVGSSSTATRGWLTHKVVGQVADYPFTVSFDANGTPTAIMALMSADITSSGSSFPVPPGLIATARTATTITFTPSGTFTGSVWVY